MKINGIEIIRESYSWDNYKNSFVVSIDQLVGVIPTYIRVEEDMITITTSQGTFIFHHEQDCCEYVRIEDITGDIQDLVGHPLLLAEEVSSEDEPAPANPDSYTWTFYKFATIKGYVDVRWLGESNGYYSESVDLVFIPNPDYKSV